MADQPWFVFEPCTGNHEQFWRPPHGRLINTSWDQSSATCLDNQLTINSVEEAEKILNWIVQQEVMTLETRDRLLNEIRSLPDLPPDHKACYRVTMERYYEQGREKTLLRDISSAMVRVAANSN